MLVEKSELSPNDVVSLKLNSGEEVVGRLSNEDQNAYELQKTYQMVLVTPKNSNQAGISFAPWMLGLSDEGSVRILKNNVIAIARSREEVKKQYIEATSGLTMSGNLG